MTGRLNEKILKKIKPITNVILDVDGVLTDGGILMDDLGNEAKYFNVRDGHGIKLLQRAGIEVMLLTGRTSKTVEFRAKDLGIQWVYQAALDKGAVIDSILKTHSLRPEQVCYVGDDIVDVPVFLRIGFAVAVADAMEYVKKTADFVTSLKGGEGAVRELCEMILKVQGSWKDVAAKYGLS